MPPPHESAYDLFTFSLPGYQLTCLLDASLPRQVAYACIAPIQLQLILRAGLGPFLSLPGCFQRSRSNLAAFSR